MPYMIITVDKRVVEIAPIVVANTAVVIYVITVECGHFRIMESWKQENSTFAGLVFSCSLSSFEVVNFGNERSNILILQTTSIFTILQTTSIFTILQTTSIFTILQTTSIFTI